MDWLGGEGWAAVFRSTFPGSDSFILYLFLEDLKFFLPWLLWERDLAFCYRGWREGLTAASHFPPRQHPPLAHSGAMDRLHAQHPALLCTS